MSIWAYRITGIVAACLCLWSAECLAAGAPRPEVDRPKTATASPAKTLRAMPPVKLGHSAGESNAGLLRFNFDNVPLDTVIDYLSKAAGFVIVKEANVEGNISIVSHQPIDRDEAADVLNTVLNQKGYAAVRNGRILTIVKRADAVKMVIPVEKQANPALIPKTDEMVTQIIPVQHADADQLLQNIQPLLPADAVASANKASNTIILTDTQANVHRIAEIISAIDGSISSISEVKVFPLQYSKAADMAKMINSLFQQPTNQGQAAGGPASFFARFRRMRGAPTQQAPESAAKQAAARVLAVADDRTNSVAVTAPGEMMPVIDQVIKQVDRDTAPTTGVRVFTLKNADATEMASVINDAFGPQNGSNTSNQLQGRRVFGRFRAMMMAQEAAGQASQDNTANAVADVRTNSVIVTAELSLLDEIGKMVERLDSNPALKQKVFVYQMKNANVEDVASVLEGMIPQQTGTTSTTSHPRQTTITSRGSSLSSTTSTSSVGSGLGSSRGLTGLQ